MSPNLQGQFEIQRGELNPNLDMEFHISPRFHRNPFNPHQVDNTVADYSRNNISVQQVEDKELQAKRDFNEKCNSRLVITANNIDNLAKDKVIFERNKDPVIKKEAPSGNKLKKEPTQIERTIGFKIPEENQSDSDRAPISMVMNDGDKLVESVHRAHFIFKYMFFPK